MRRSTLKLIIMSRTWCIFLVIGLCHHVYLTEIIDRFCQYGDRSITVNESFTNDQCYECVCSDSLEIQCQTEKTTKNCKIEIESAKFISQSVILVNFADRNLFKDYPLVEISHDSERWSTVPMLPGGYVINVEAPKLYLKLKNGKKVLTVQNDLLNGRNDKRFDRVKKLHEDMTESCTLENVTITLNEYYNDCKQLCLCHKSELICKDIHCPILSNLQDIDPYCLKWDMVPKNFTAEVPKCCPDDVVCVDNGSCLYNEEYHADNWAEIPENVTGCENKCYCELGKIECHNACESISANPSLDLSCGDDRPTIVKVKDHTCCIQWACPSNETGEFKIKDTVLIGDTYVNLKISIPEGVIGLNGYLKVLYTLIEIESGNNYNELENDPFFVTTNTSVFQNNEFLYKLTDLDPNSDYNITLIVKLTNFNSSLVSESRLIRTELVSILYNADLKVIAVNITWVRIGWKEFSDYDLQLFTGVKLRFREINTSSFLETHLIESANNFVLDNLKSGTKYEVQMLLIPESRDKPALEKNSILFTTLSSSGVELLDDDHTTYKSDDYLSEIIVYFAILALLIILGLLGYRCFKRNRKYTANITSVSPDTLSQREQQQRQNYHWNPQNNNLSSNYKVEFHKNS